MSDIAFDDMEALFGNRVGHGDLKRIHQCKNPIVYILSHDIFEGFETRPGREEDEIRIKHHFESNLNCHVLEPFVNLTAEQVKSTLAQEAQRDLQDHDAIIIWVITQFDRVGQYLAKEGFYTENEVTTYFKGYTSPEIIAKPKIFFFQASKAVRPLVSEQLRRISTTEVDGGRRKEKVSYYSLPVDANLFIVRSSLPFLTENKSTWFVNEVCNKLICRLPLHEEIVKLLKSCQEQIELNTDNVTPMRIPLTFIPDVTSTLLYKVFLSDARINMVDHCLEYYDRAQENGCIFIFNYTEVYDEDRREFNSRTGTENDCSRMITTFANLGFDVFVETNLSKKDLTTKLSTITDEDFSNYMCVVIAFFTHGHNGLLGTLDKDIPPSEVIESLGSNESLRGKPKIVIFQVCRGDVLSDGVLMKGQVEEAQDYVSDNEDDGYMETDAGRIRVGSFGGGSMIPRTLPEPVEETAVIENPLLKVENTIVFHSAYTGTAAIRDVKKGTWLIQELCSEINRQTPNLQEASLADIFTNVQMNVALKTYANKKQMPVYTSTLTNKVLIGRRSLNDVE